MVNTQKKYPYESRTGIQKHIAEAFYCLNGTFTATPASHLGSASE